MGSQDDSAEQFAIDDSPDRPRAQMGEQHENPQLWPDSTRKRIIIITGIFAFLEPFASAMVAPSLDLVSTDLSITSSVKRNLVLSAFVLPYAFANLIQAPLSEVFGRKPILIASASIFMGFSLACGFATSSDQLIVFRVFAGFGGCVPFALTAPIIGDVYDARSRGSALAWCLALEMAGPAAGPMVGGWIVQKLDSWRWQFYVCAIAISVAIVFGVFSLPETYAPKLNCRTPHKHSVGQCFEALARPLVLLATQPIIQVLAIYNGAIFGTYYLFLTTIVRVFEDQYGHSVGVSSLHYIALVLGLSLGNFFCGSTMDMSYRRLRARASVPEDVSFPEARIPYLAASATLLPAGLLLFGWTAQHQVFWLIPDVGLFLVGVGVLAPFLAIQHYVLDCYSGRHYSASALAALNAVQFLTGFGFPLFADALFDALNLGWGDTLLALMVAIAGTASIFLWRYGPQLRKMSSFSDQ